MVPPWINKFYILDLNPQKSFLRWMVDQGLTVFCISWVNPDARHADKDFESYMREGIEAAIDAIGVATGESEVDGGRLLRRRHAARRDARHAGGHAATRGSRARRCFTTQVDFTHAGDLKVFADEEQIRQVEARMAEQGYLDGAQMANAFNMLRPNDLIWPYVVNNYIKGKTPSAFDLLYWNSDATRMPAANHSFYLRNCYLDNTLAQGRMVLGNVRLDLKKVQAPIFNLATREDHIAPALSVFEGSKTFGGKVDFVLAGSGHIAGVINPPSKPKYGYWTGGPVKGTLEDWISRRRGDQGLMVALLVPVARGAGARAGRGPEARGRRAAVAGTGARHLRADARLRRILPGGMHPGRRCIASERPEPGRSAGRTQYFRTSGAGAGAGGAPNT